MYVHIADAGVELRLGPGERLQEPLFELELVFAKPGSLLACWMADVQGVLDQARTQRVSRIRTQLSNRPRIATKMVRDRTQRDGILVAEIRIASEQCAMPFCG